MLDYPRPLRILHDVVAVRDFVRVAFDVNGLVVRRTDALDVVGIVPPLR
jgi:hypothetical protein